MEDSVEYQIWNLSLVKNVFVRTQQYNINNWCMRYVIYLSEISMDIKKTKVKFIKLLFDYQLKVTKQKE